MALWILYAISASFLWALVNISDQYLVAKYSSGEKTSGGLVLFSSLIGLLVAAGMFVFVHNLFQIPTLDKLILLICGAFTIGWVILYLFTLEIEEVSLVVPWFLTVPVFGYLFGYFFLGESLTHSQILGSLVTILGLILLQVNFSAAKVLPVFKIKPSLYMLAACLIIAIQGILFKYVTIEDNFWVSSFWQYLGLGITGLLIFVFVPTYRREFMRMNKEGGKEIFALNVTSEVTSVVGNLLSSFATLLAPVTLVYLLGSFQPVFVLLFSVLGTIFLPKIITEDISRRTLIPKFIAILIMTIGSVILFS